MTISKYIKRLSDNSVFLCSGAIYRTFCRINATATKVVGHSLNNL